MDVEATEEQLYVALSTPRELNASQLTALSVNPPESIQEVAAVGIDTNVLKALRKDLPFAEQLFVTIRSSQARLIAPSQSLTEYWNNHQTFADEEANGFRGDLRNLKDRLERSKFSGYDQDVLNDIESLVERVSGDLEDTKSPAYLQRSIELFQTMLETAIVPHVSRSRFAELAAVRLSSKTPPGFRDEKEKSAPGGDFFVWCDFMLGVLLEEDGDARDRYLWITNENKADWKTGGRGHPSLIQEFHTTCNGKLSILTLAELRKLVRADEQRRAALAREQATDRSADPELEATSASASESGGEDTFPTGAQI